MIDTNILKYSTTDYRQYMAYIRDIKDTTIDITKTSAIHVQFNINLILFMGSIII